MLHNPKHLGFQVWNRRGSRQGRRGKLNPPSKWVWSPAPVHEPIISRSLYEAAAAVAPKNGRPRYGVKLNPHPDTKRTYLLRSFVFHTECGRRMQGATRKAGVVYFVCKPVNSRGRGGREGKFPHHDYTAIIREDQLLDGVLAGISERLFSPDRRSLLEAELRAADDGDRTEQQRRLDAARKAVAEVEARQRRLVRSLEDDDDVDGSMRKVVRARLQELAADLDAAASKVAELEAAIDDTEPVPSPELLDSLPIVPDLTRRSRAAPRPVHGPSAADRLQQREPRRLGHDRPTR